jgi:hypothetical protein
LKPTLGLVYKPDTMDAARDRATAFHTQTLRAFVARHTGMRQRDAQWYELMGTTVGGSEIAGLLGLEYSPDSTAFERVVRDKVALLRGAPRWAGNVMCWWGQLFEDVLADYVGIDLDAPVYGDNICIRIHAGHRTSPDGYVVAQLERVDGALVLCTTPPRTPRSVPAVLMLEFKCPFSRVPEAGVVPAKYIPQLWSGLAVSPLAFCGMYVDAVFRKCALAVLGPGPDYDTEYHARDRDRYANAAPVAWGLAGVYADSASGYADDAGALVDLGAAGCDCEFADALRDIASGAATVWRPTPCFADGRGNDDSARPLLDQLPTHCGAAGLVAVIPWKLFTVDYVFVTRRAGFAGEMLPIIERVHAAVRSRLKNNSVATPAAPSAWQLYAAQMLYDGM